MKFVLVGIDTVLDAILQTHNITPVSYVNLSPNDFKSTFTNIKERGGAFTGSDDNWYNWNNITFYLDVHEEDYEI